MMKGGDIAGLLIRQARLRLNWSQEGLCRGICAPSYLSKIEQGKAAPSPEVMELLFRRLGLVWTPEPESLEPCWKALLSGSPDFVSCYERLVQPRQEVLACSPLAADALLLDAFYEDNMRPLPVEWEPFLSNRQLALQRGLQGRWEEAVRLESLPLLVTLRGKALYVKGDYTVAIEVLRDACRSAADAGYPHLMLSCRLWMGNCYSDLGRMEEMLALVRYRLEHPGYLHDSTYGTQLLDCFQHLRDTYPMGFTRFHLPWVLAWYKANRQYRQACRLLEEFPVK